MGYQKQNSKTVFKSVTKNFILKEATTEDLEQIKKYFGQENTEKIDCGRKRCMNNCNF